ncbi:restriction endonuclease subunit S [Vibrio vulnificus]|nr:restriction endonuclease subunit S [Vibrio vulnificus]EHH1183488.1 restriction endonuclease subunit S [Vibrio vulnificus]EHH2485470.1 restriction endonuclease subunit S [Vibrio vulnificus]EHU4794239.1 restriction endonuclease subunit S [Vibrio vulnificus]EHU4866541.1 restriction endonuclease subunit S [Vibrio vulnificus]
MNSEWPLHSLSDFINVKHGFAFKGEFFKAERTSDLLVTPGNFAIGGGFKSDKFKFYDGPVPEDYVLSEGDLIVTMTDLSKQADTLGYSALVPAIAGSRLLHNQRVGLVEFKNDELDITYLYFLLRSKEYRHHVVSTATGSTVKHTSPTKILSFAFRKPPKDIQIDIGKKLIALEEKIENNTQTNQTLEQIAQAIFKSWFVDFDPVKAKMETLAAGGSADDAELAAMRVISAKTLDELNSLKASNPEAFNKLAQTAALFPAAMQDSELGEIPEGWEVSDLASCTTELRRGISPKYIEEGGVLVINQKCIRNHTVDFSLARRNDSSKRKVDGREIAIGDVLVNSTGVGTLGRLAPIRFLNETTVADSHVTVVRANTTKISKSFLAGLMLTNEAYIEASGAGSTGQTELRKQVLEDIKFVKPLSAVDRLFDEIISNFNAQTAELEKQRVTLSLTRDVLLPKLLSGEIDLTSEVVE